MHLLQLGIIYNRVHREIGLHVTSTTTLHDIPQIVQREISRRTGAHIQSFHPKINRVRPCL